MINGLFSTWEVFVGKHILSDLMMAFAAGNKATFSEVVIFMDAFLWNCMALRILECIGTLGRLLEL